MHDRNTFHQVVGDLYRDDESHKDMMIRIRAHAKATFPCMSANYRFHLGSQHSAIDVAITEYRDADLTVREEGHAVRRRVEAEIERFTRYDWDPIEGSRRHSAYVTVSIDPSLRAAAVKGAPELESRVSFAEFTRRARAGDILEHVDGEMPTQGRRVEIVAISSRRLTTRPADPSADGRPTRYPIQGGACFVSDGELVCFKHSGFAPNGGYSLLRWRPAA